MGKEFAIPLAALAVTMALGLLGILASLGGGAASVFVAMYSWRTSERATAIAADAADAEARRDERAVLREKELTEEARAARLTSLVEKIILGVSEWIAARDGDELWTFPQAASSHVNIALMHGTYIEQDILKETQQILLALGYLNNSDAHTAVGALVGNLAGWRSSHRNELALGHLRELLADTRSKADTRRPGNPATATPEETPES